MTVEHLLLLAAAQLVALVSPGPAALRLMQTSLTADRRSALKFGAGLASAAACWAALAFAGLGVLFTALPWLFIIMKVLGGLYLIYVAVQIWRGATAPIVPGAGVRNRRAFVSGWLTNASNPKAAFFFSAVFLTILAQQTTLIEQAGVVTLVLVIELLWYTAMVALFTHSRSQSLYLRAKAMIDRSCSALLAALGISIIASR